MQSKLAEFVSGRKTNVLRLKDESQGRIAVRNYEIRMKGRIY